MIGAGLPEACQHLTHVHGHVDVYLHENAPAMAATAANASERLAPFGVAGAQERMLLDQYRFSRLQHILAPRVGDHGRGMRDAPCLCRVRIAPSFAATPRLSSCKTRAGRASPIARIRRATLAKSPGASRLSRIRPSRGLS